MAKQDEDSNSLKLNQKPRSQGLTIFDNQNETLISRGQSNKSQESRPGRKLKPTGDYIGDVQSKSIFKEDSGSDAP